MQKTLSRGGIIEIAIFSFASFLLYNMGMWIAFFLVPLQVILVRRGRGALALSAGAVSALLLLYCVYALVAKPGTGILSGAGYAVQLVPALCLLAGLIVLNLQVLDRLRAALRLLIAAAAAGAGTLLIYGLAALLAPGFSATVLGLFADATQLMRSWAMDSNPQISAAFSMFRDPEAFMGAALEGLLYFFAFMEFAVLGFAWFVGGAVASRMAVPRAPEAGRPRLGAFRLQTWFVWPLIAGGALIVISLFVPIAEVSIAAAAVGWNAGLAFWVLFGAQGMAILKFVYEKHRLPRLVWTLTVLGILALFMHPDLRLVPIIALPALGVSENWIRFRIPRDPEADDLGKE